ncbi:hypothetical protein Esi_0258_0024 [Ectocarpus siliculosus]|uniref:Uncharacterized protein n=1 Tax=Ectocarpus siliculosus TaxID=2880 RepID=D8LJH2_ECTSI|nr:hypothetical protein Esi_0258_0024 [Ectocarpus siliculosus]|eukprot:CBN75973.1 hypothetical protein Esi_0258_0024 [Ectocarpus siliculosus]
MTEWIWTPRSWWGGVRSWFPTTYTRARTAARCQVSGGLVLSRGFGVGGTHPCLHQTLQSSIFPGDQRGQRASFYDRRQNGSHWNNDKERRVFLTPAHLFTDAFDFRNQGGVSYPIKATLLSPFASTSQAFRRQPGAWPLVGLSAPRVRWQDDLGFILEVISVLQKGCRARLAIADKVEEVFFRLGLLLCDADSPERQLLLGMKRVTNKTLMPCHVCPIGQEDLADGNYDIVRNRRTDDQTEYALKVISTAPTGTQRQALSSKHGVTPQEVENPFRKHVHLNMVRTFGIDLFHQDAQNSLRKIFKRLLGGLSKAKGVPLLSCLAKDPSLRVAGTPPLRDFVSDGGFSALSGMDVWTLSSVALLVFRPVLRSVASMKRLTTAPFRNDIRAELGATTDTVVTDTEVMEKLRALLLASSEATHLLRSSSFNDETVASIDRSQREKTLQSSIFPGDQRGQRASFYDRRQNGSHWNNDKERRVFLTPAHLFTDAFDFRNQGGVSYPIKATLLSPFASTSQAFRRQPGAWPLVGLSAPRVRWQDDLGFILEVISVLQKGCRARLAIADKVEEVFFRLGLLLCDADSPERQLLLGMKRVTNKTLMPCHVCPIGQEDLADGNYDIVRNRRTDDQTEYALKVISTAPTGTQRQALSSKHGVTPQEVENPFRKHVHLNMVRTFGIDLFHQDAQNSLRKIFKRLLGGLSKAKGVPLLSCLAKDPSLRVAGTPPLRDFVSDGGFSALSGMDVWTLSSVALLVFRPVLRSVASMVRLPDRNASRPRHSATTSGRSWGRQQTPW